MIAWIFAHIATILICFVLLLAIAGAITALIKDRKKGRSSCGCHCSSCPMGSACHKGKSENHDTRQA